MTAEKQHEMMESQHQLRVILAMTTLLLCCLATAPCGYVLLNFRKFNFPSRTLLCTGILAVSDMANCWLLLCFNIPTQLKGQWLFGHSVCLLQAFLSRLLKGGVHLALITLAVQGCCVKPWTQRSSFLLRHVTFFFFLSWTVMGFVSVCPFVLEEVSYVFHDNLFFCDVCDQYFLMHDVLTYCVPFLALSFLSVRLVVLTFRDQTTATVPSSQNSDSYVTDDDVTETSRITSHPTTNTSRACCVRRPGSCVHAKWTMSVCFLSVETAGLMMVEWSFRLWGMLLPSPSLLVSSVLFACAGYIVRPTTLLIVDRAYSGGSLLTSHSSSALTEDGTMTSRARQRHKRHHLSISEMDRNRLRRWRRDSRPALPGMEPLSAGRIQRFSRRQSRLSLASSTVGCPAEGSRQKVSVTFPAEVSTSSALSVCTHLFDVMRPRPSLMRGERDGF